ncbi:hypothetical protein GF391_04410 [Candidatus Uhrbacteria bacterium]|nr:hypothetical protein [Candidatus Uhrbacteria bacterium]
MNIPDNLQNFPEPSLILIGDFGKTIIHKAHGINIDELRVVESRDPAFPDSESTVIVSKGIRAHSDAAHNKEEDRKHYAKDIVEALTDFVDDHDIKDIQLIMPTELYNLINQYLSRDVQDLITRHLNKDLTKSDLVEALERLLEIPKDIN